MVALFLCTTPFIEAPLESLSAIGFLFISIPIWLVQIKYKSKIISVWNGNDNYIYIDIREKGKKGSKKEKKIK